MEELIKNKVIDNVCIYIDKGDPINILDLGDPLYYDGKFYDTDTPCFGYFSNLKATNFNECINEYKNNIKKEYDDIYQKISTDEYMDYIIGIIDEYNNLTSIVKKYRRRRIGNPDVDKLLAFSNKYRFEILNAKFDIGVSNIMINSVRDGKHYSKFYDKNESLSKNERREFMKEAINSIIDDEMIYFDNDVAEIKESYESFTNKLNELLQNNKSVLIIVFPFAKIKNDILELNIKDFSIDAYIKGRSYIYRITK